MKKTEGKKLRSLLLMLWFLSSSLLLQAQVRGTFSGKVVDQQGNPMIGVTVRPDGGKTGVITNADGEFRYDDKGQQSRTFVFS